MLYVIIAGFLVPLRPGIKTSSPTSVRVGQEQAIDVTGYNSNWNDSPDEIRVWLKYKDEYVLKATGIEVRDERHLKAYFNFPSAPPESKETIPLTLIIDHPADGPSVLPTALILSSDGKEASIDEWTGESITDLHFKKKFAFPYRNVLLETIRNTYFHVPLWMAMYALLALSTWYNILYLRKGDPMKEERAYHLALVSLLFGTLGIATGMMWAEHTWGRFWSWDIKQTMSLLAMLMYVAYVFIRFSIPDEKARRRFNAVYGIFAFTMIFPLLYIVPRMAASLHPGSGGNPALGGEDMDNTMRMVFYPAIIGYFLIGLWVSQLSFRVQRAKHRLAMKI